MSPLSTAISSGVGPSGGVISYPSAQLYEEVAYVAYHFHWQREDILNLEHYERQRWVKEIEKIRQ
jgi:hypothetical protein